MNDNLPPPVSVRAADASAVEISTLPSVLAVFALVVRVALKRFSEKLPPAFDPNGGFAARLDEAAREAASALGRAAAGEPGEPVLLERALGREGVLRSDVDLWFAASGCLPWTWEEAAAASEVPPPRPRASSDPVRARLQAVGDTLREYDRWLANGATVLDAANVALLLLERLRAATLLRLLSLKGVSPRRFRPGATSDSGEDAADAAAARMEGLASASSGFPNAGAALAKRPVAAAAAPADGKPPRCPKCGAPMRKRVKRDTGEAFWGCSEYAAGCRGTRPIA